MPASGTYGRAVNSRDSAPILHNTLGARMDRHAATRRLKQLAAAAGIQIPGCLTKRRRVLPGDRPRARPPARDLIEQAHHLNLIRAG